MSYTSSKPDFSIAGRAELLAVKSATEEGGLRIADKLDAHHVRRLHDASEAIAGLLGKLSDAHGPLRTACQEIEIGPGYLRQFFRVKQRGIDARTAGAHFWVNKTGAIEFRSAQRRIANTDKVIPPTEILIPSTTILDRCKDSEKIHMGAYALYTTYYLPDNTSAKREIRPSLTIASKGNELYLRGVSDAMLVFGNIMSQVVRHPDFPSTVFDRFDHPTLQPTTTDPR